MLLCVTTAEAQVNQAQVNKAPAYGEPTQAYRIVHASTKKSLRPAAYGARADDRSAHVDEFEADRRMGRALDAPQRESFHWVICKALETGPSQLGRPLDVSVLRFDAKRQSPGSYFLVCARTSLVLHPETGNVDVNCWGMLPRTHPHSRYQRWRIELGSGVPNGPYKDGDTVTLVNVASGRALTTHPNSRKGSAPAYCGAGLPGDGPLHRADRYQWKLQPAAIPTKYKLTLESMRCVRPSTGQDEWTAVMFRMVDVALAAAGGAQSSGASLLAGGAKDGMRVALGTMTRNGLKAGTKKAIAVTRDTVLKTAFLEARRRRSRAQGSQKSTADDAVKLATEFMDFRSRKSQKIFNMIYGESPDDLEVRINGISVWPNGGRDHRKMASQHVARPGTDFIFSPHRGASIALIEYDSASDDDFMGSVKWNAPRQGLGGRPERFEKIIVQHHGEGSLYELTVRISPMIPLPPTVELFGLVRLTSCYEGTELKVRVDGYVGGDGRLELRDRSTPDKKPTNGRAVPEAVMSRDFPISKQKPGSYVVEFTDEGRVLTQNFFEVVRPALEAPESYEQGQSITIRWSGLLSSDSIIALGPKGDDSLSAAFQVGRVQSVSEQGKLAYSGEFTFTPRPEVIFPGHLALRLYDGNGDENLLAASRPILLRRAVRPPWSAALQATYTKKIDRRYALRNPQLRTRSNETRTVYLGTLDRGVRYEVAVFGQHTPELTLVDAVGNRTVVESQHKGESTAFVVPRFTQKYRAEVTMSSDEDKLHDWMIFVARAPAAIALGPKPKMSKLVSLEVNRMLNIVKGNLKPGQKLSIDSEHKHVGGKLLHLGKLERGFKYVVIVVGDARCGQLQMTKLEGQWSRKKAKSWKTKSGASVAVVEWKPEGMAPSTMQVLSPNGDPRLLIYWELVVLKIPPPPAIGKQD